jgi:hypothetical protein
MCLPSMCPRLLQRIEGACVLSAYKVVSLCPIFISELRRLADFQSE